LIEFTMSSRLEEELAVVELERSDTPDSLEAVLSGEEVVTSVTAVLLTRAAPWADVLVSGVVLAVSDGWVDIITVVTEEEAFAAVGDRVEVGDTEESVLWGVVTEANESPDEFSVALDVVFLWDTAVLNLVSEVDTAWVPVSGLDGEALAVVIGFGLDGEFTTTVVVVEEVTLEDGSWDVTTADAVGSGGAWVNLVETRLALGASSTSGLSASADDSNSPPLIIRRSLVAFAHEGTFGVVAGSVLVAVVDLEDALVDVEAVAIF